MRLDGRAAFQAPMFGGWKAAGPMAAWPQPDRLSPAPLASAPTPNGSHSVKRLWRHPSEIGDGALRGCGLLMCAVGNICRAVVSSQARAGDSWWRAQLIIFVDCSAVT